MPDDDDTGDGETLEETVERMFQERVTADEKKKNRGKQPKDFGEFLDRIKDEVADGVLEKIDARNAKRREDADNADQEPERGDAKGGFGRWWGGE